VTKTVNKSGRLRGNAPQPSGLAFRRKLENANRYKRREGFGTYLFLVPAALGVLFVLVYPVFRTLWLSLTDTEGAGEGKFVGIANYLTLINDPILLRTMSNVAIWTIGTMALPVLLGLIIAYVALGLKGSAIYRMIFLLPYVLSGVAVASIWFHIFQTKGLFNQFLGGIGLEKYQQSWLLNYPQNTISMIIAATWAGTGLIVVLFTVGLQNIPLQTVEAATLDGANSWQMFRSIIWPQLKQIRAVVIGTALANSLRTFDIVWVMTGGGPSRSSETLGVTMYRESFLLNRYGYGASIAVLLMVLVIGVSYFALRGGLKRENSL
jgi:ABC-type sugar transport system permease subunit